MCTVASEECGFSSACRCSVVCLEVLAADVCPSSSRVRCVSGSGEPGRLAGSMRLDVEPAAVAGMLAGCRSSSGV